ncbi:MAG: DUF108 domain-containing protein [Candidatus Omnitrophica bacterium]|nr:DUF108 domain-containing protein [Candidatus Omnitrophota bacterium]
MEKIKLAIIGCGNIGSAVLRFAVKELSGRVSAIYLWDTDAARMDVLVKELKNPQAAKDMGSAVSDADLIVECVSPRVASELLNLSVKKKKDLIVLSAGGLLGKEKLLEEADVKGVKIIVPSGALAGIDALKAAKMAGISRVTLTTRKPPASMRGVKYLMEKGVNVDEIRTETVVFDGPAKDAIKYFPANINVSIILSLAGIGPEKTKVRIVVSPEFTTNSHEVVVEGASGTIKTLTDNVPSPINPKTSYLAVLSATAALKGYFQTVRIGN